MSPSHSRYSERGADKVPLGSQRDLGGNFHNVQSLDVLQEKEDEVPKLPAAGAHWVHQPWLPVGTDIYRSAGITWRTGEEPVARPRLGAAEPLAGSSVSSSFRDTGRRAALEFAAAAGATYPPEPPLTRSRQPSRSRDFWGYRSPAGTRLSRGTSGNLPVRAAQALLCALQTSTSRELTCRSAAPTRCLEAVRMRGSPSREHPWLVPPALCF